MTLSKFFTNTQANRLERQFCESMASGENTYFPYDINKGEELDYVSARST